MQEEFGVIKKGFENYEVSNLAMTFIPNENNDKNYVDHINNDKLDNNINNLRWVTPQENMFNSKISKTNKCGIKGVYFDKKRNKWRAFIQIDGISLYLGSYETVEEAQQARINKLNQAFGEFTNICFTSSKKLYKKLKAIDNNITMKDVKEFYQQQEETEIIKPVSKMKYTFNSITARYPGDIYEIDILVYNRFEQHKQKYILVVIDIYSRFVQALPMSSLEMSKVIPKLVEIIKVMGSPYKIKADNEFDNQYFNKLMNELHVKTSFSDPYEINKNAIVERFNKTLALQLQRLFKKVVDNYNNTYHETTKHSPPDEIFNKGMFNEQTIIRVIPSLEVGDNVRKIIEKKTFSKVDRQTHSTEVYKILKIEK
eukprot:gene16744-22904_t